MEPRVFDEGKVKRPEELLRMPKFWTSDEEAENVVTAVMSFTKEQVPLAACLPQQVLGPEYRVLGVLLPPWQRPAGLSHRSAAKAKQGRSWPEWTPCALRRPECPR